MRYDIFGAAVSSRVQMPVIGGHNDTRFCRVCFADQFADPAVNLRGGLESGRAQCTALVASLIIRAEVN